MLMKLVRLFRAVFTVLMVVGLAFAFWHDQQRLVDKEREEASQKAESTRIHAMTEKAFNEAHPECVDYKTISNLPVHCY